MLERKRRFLNALNAELNPIRHLLALVGARHIVHVSSIRVNVGNPRKIVTVLLCYNSFIFNKIENQRRIFFGIFSLPFPDSVSFVADMTR